MSGGSIDGGGPGDSPPLLRESWLPVFGDAWTLAALLAALAVAVRGVALLGTGVSWLLPAGFVLMALTPHLFLRREGRRRAGLRLPRRPQWLLWGVLLGAAGAALCFWLGITLFGDSHQNWFVSVRRSFPVSPEMARLPTAQLFWIVTIPSLIFSPIGEEVFFRGLFDQAASERWGRRSGMLLDAGVFALVHLFHHGLLRIDGQIRLLPLSGAIWMLLIFGTGLLFAWLRRRAGSLLAPILSHAAFNLTMNFTIFYLL